MSVGRNLLLWASKNEQLKQKLPKYKFVQSAVKKFMPGETPADAIEAAKKLSEFNIPTTFTYLGENINNLNEGKIVKEHYLSLLKKIDESKHDIEISLKLTQLGFDISFNETLISFIEIVERAKQYDNFVFIDIEDSSYVDKTIDFYKKVKKDFDNVGLCLQAYLYRTKKDIEQMLDIRPAIRLVKGAYNEPDSVAFKSKKDVDKNYFELSNYLLEHTKKSNIRVAYGTHDLMLQEQIKQRAVEIELPKEKLEFQMLYGIKSNEQIKLAEDGYNIRTLISYGDAWYPWYMRRLAERPANVGFVLKNLFS